MFCIVYDEYKNKYKVKAMSQLTIEERQLIYACYRSQRDAWDALKSLSKRVKKYV